jgi:tetratricopeptide (TPR) repeat protein
LKASKRLWEGNPEQAEKYWQEGIEWKEKAYTSYEELSDTDPSKKQDCALTAAQLGKEFANQENFEKAVEWYEKALQHDPSNKFIIQELEALAEALEILEASEEVNRARY